MMKINYWNWPKMIQLEHTHTHRQTDNVIDTRVDTDTFFPNIYNYKLIIIYIEIIKLN